MKDHLHGNVDELVNGNKICEKTCENIMALFHKKYTENEISILQNGHFLCQMSLQKGKDRK